MRHSVSIHPPKIVLRIVQYFVHCNNIVIEDYPENFSAKLFQETILRQKQIFQFGARNSL